MNDVCEYIFSYFKKNRPHFCNINKIDITLYPLVRFPSTFIEQIQHCIVYNSAISIFV